MAREVKPYTPEQIEKGNKVIRVMSRTHAAILRWSNGRVASRFLRGAPTGLLHHTGAKSAKAYESPLLVLVEGDDLVIVASKGGFPEHPSWYFNLLANPQCRFTFRGTTSDRTARVATDDEREVLWPKLDAMYRDFADYRERARQVGRRVEMFILEPR